MMAAILNSAMLDSDTAILDSDTLLSSLRFTQKHSHSTLTLTQTNSIWLKLIHSHSTWWWQPSWILPSWIQPSWIQTPCYLLSDSLKNTCHSDSDSNYLHNLTQTHSFSLNLMMAAILNSAILDSAILDSDTLLSSLRFTQKHSHSTPLWLKLTWLIHSHSTWWWQPSWILPSWIQTPCYLLSDSLKNTLTPLWLWLKLIQSDSNSFILT